MVFPDQPVLDKKTKTKPKPKLSIVDHHAEALLAILNAEALSDQSVDVITHSFGSLVLARAADLAKERGLKCFDEKEGSHTIFVAPAGTNEKENLFTLGYRWGRFIVREANPLPIGNFYTKELDPSGEMLKAGQKNANADKVKTLKEVGSVIKKEKMYKRLGEAGVRPYIIGFSNDVLMPHHRRESSIAIHENIISGYSMPIDSEGSRVGAFSRAPSLAEFIEKTGLKGEEAKRIWTHHYVNQGHNDLLFHPKRTVSAVLQVLDGRIKGPSIDLKI